LEGWCSSQLSYSRFVLFRSIISCPQSKLALSVGFLNPSP
jgi:hypothetical protein